MLKKPRIVALGKWFPMNSPQFHSPHLMSTTLLALDRDALSFYNCTLLNSFERHKCEESTVVWVKDRVSCDRERRSLLVVVYCNFCLP